MTVPDLATLTNTQNFDPVVAFQPSHHGQRLDHPTSSRLTARSLPQPPLPPCPRPAPPDSKALHVGELVATNKLTNTTTKKQTRTQANMPCQPMSQPSTESSSSAPCSSHPRCPEFPSDPWRNLLWTGSHCRLPPCRWHGLPQPTAT